MEFTPEDIKAIELLRKMASRRTTRSMKVITSLWSLQAFLAVLLAAITRKMEIMIIAPLYALSAVLLVNQAIAFRNGNPIMLLLLKLVDNALTQDAKIDVQSSDGPTHV